MRRSVALAANSGEQLEPFDEQHAAQRQVELLRQFFSAGVQFPT